MSRRSNETETRRFKSISSNKSSVCWINHILTSILIAGFSIVGFEAHIAAAGANEVVGEPFISCSADAIYAKWKTKSTFTGHVNVRYTPNRYCFQVLVTNNQIELLIPHQDCQINRRRSINPPGVILESSVLISFHSEYITANDRLYLLQCIHARNVHDHHSLLPGSVHTTTPPYVQPPMRLPQCEYRVLNSRDRSLVDRVLIGEYVLHEWSCYDVLNEQNDLCLMVTNCFMLTSNSKHLLIDERGCSVDDTIIPELNYSDKLNVSQNVSVFGIEQKPYVRYQCQLSLLPSKNGTCPTPRCTTAKTRKRKSLQSMLSDPNANILDAISQEVEIVEFGRTMQSEMERRSRCDTESAPKTVIERINSAQVVCISRLSFAVVSISTILVAICTLLVVIISMVQRFRFHESTS